MKDFTPTPPTHVSVNTSPVRISASRRGASEISQPTEFIKGDWRSNVNCAAVNDSLQSGSAHMWRWKSRSLL
jgi:hypothetical protein